MKTGMKSRLGLGFMAALAGLYAQSTERDLVNHYSDSMMFMGGNSSSGSPMYFTRNPNRKRKVNKLRLSHNAKLKRRRAA